MVMLTMLSMLILTNGDADVNHSDDAGSDEEGGDGDGDHDDDGSDNGNSYFCGVILKKKRMKHL